MEQYRPYILMMIAAPWLRGIPSKRNIPAPWPPWKKAWPISANSSTVSGRRKRMKNPTKCAVLKRLLRDLRRKLPVDPTVRLQQRLSKAVKEERYEDAARLRDEIARKSEPTEPA